MKNKFIKIEDHKAKKRNARRCTLADGRTGIIETMLRSELSPEARDFQDLLGGIPMYRITLSNDPKRGV